MLLLSPERRGAQGVNVGYVQRHLMDFGLTWVFAARNTTICNRQGNLSGRNNYK